MLPGFLHHGKQSKASHTRSALAIGKEGYTDPLGHLPWTGTYEENKDDKVNQLVQNFYSNEEIDGQNIKLEYENRLKYIANDSK